MTDNCQTFAMSTPTTATATHPSHHPRYGYSHYQPTPSYPTTTSAADAARLANSYAYAVHNPLPNSSSLSLTHASKMAPATSTPNAAPSTPSGTHSVPVVGRSGGKKKPDWGEFYKNGIPKEVIVIDDSPAPEPNKVASRSTASAAAAAVFTANGSQTQPAGKRRKTGMDSNYDVLYYDRPSYSINPPAYGEDSSAGSISTDRTTSLHTTAPTSLGSHGSSGTSNGLYYEDANVGQKRKRVTTRKSARDEQKRRELETFGDAFRSYVPPPNPPIKAKDVPVPVIRDVS